MLRVHMRALGGSFVAVLVLVHVGCGNNALPPGSNLGGANTGPSQSRLNAARLIVDPSTMTVDLLQQDLTIPTQVSCDPLDLDPTVLPAAHTRWSSRIGGPHTMDFFQAIPPAFAPLGAYDFLFTANETDYILSMRIPNPAFDPNFTQVEFNFRAVNRHTVGHVFSPASDPYTDPQANFPSNDDVPANRSLIDFGAARGDVAILVQGMEFVHPTPIRTRAFMNFLGPTAWVLFMRDNAIQSGRFYNINGARKGGPPAYADVPPPGPPPQGFFQSAQVTGDLFDVNSEPPANMDPINFLVHPCLGGPTRDYAFLDRSNIDAFGVFDSGRGGFLLVIRRPAFHTGIPAGAPSRVVLDPSGPPMAINNALDTIEAPRSGYNESPFVPLFLQAGAHISNHATPPDPANDASRPRGVHEIGVSVFFIHQPIP